MSLDTPAGRVLLGSLRSAGAVMTIRGGRTVAAHYGSTTAELSVCVSHVGLGVRSDLGVLELTARDGRLGETLSAVLDGVPLTCGWAISNGSGWCALVTPGSALVVGPPAETARWRRVVTGAARRAGRAITCEDRSLAVLVVTLVGPRLEELLERASLPVDVAPGGVRSCLLDGAPTTLLRTLPDRCLLVVPIAFGAAACWELLDAGEPLGSALVGIEALARLAAAERHAQAFA